MNVMEGQLRSWPLRRPSPKVEALLFERVPPERSRPPTSAWLVPAMAAMLVMVTLWNHWSGTPLERTEDSMPFMTMVYSNGGLLNLSALACERTGRNSVPAETFEWTNVRASTSSVRSLSSITNY